MDEDYTEAIKLLERKKWNGKKEREKEAADAGGEKKEMGKRIKIARIRADMTQEMLADAVGIVPVYVSQIESGLRNPSLEIIVKYSQCAVCICG